jgi:hypothetical protein
VYLAPETSRFFASRGQRLPAQGLMSTLISTERALESRYVDGQRLPHDRLNARVLLPALAHASEDL